MPITSGARGAPGVLAIPGASRTGSSLPPVRKFRSPALARSNPVLTGVTRDSTGTPLGGCAVKLFRTVNDAFLNAVTSDVSGNFSIVALGSGPFYLVAYLPGSPDVAGTTVNTLSAD